MYSIGQNIVDRVMKLSKIGFSMECFTASHKGIKISLQMSGRALDFNSKHFGDFFEIF